MKVVLVHVKENFTPVPPTGLLYIGTMLKRDGHDVRVYDVNFKEKDLVMKKIVRFAPELVGFTSMTSSYSITRQFNNELKKLLPDAYYCWGGVHATALPEETIKDNNLDFLVYGEGEYTMLEVCKKLSRKHSKSLAADLHDVKGVYYVDGKTIKKTTDRGFIQDLDNLPIPDRSLLENFRWYLSPPGILRGKFYYGITTMYTSRGCPYQCIFCASKIVHGCKIRRRSVDNVLEEMVYLKDKFGVRGIYFNDDTFATDLDWLKEFCERLSKSCLGLVWGCQTRANIAQDIKILAMMKKAGCVQVDIGCESGSNRILKNLKKGITVDMILKSFDNLKRLRMETFATFIVGNPGETLDDIRLTESVAKQAPGGVSFLILVPYPGSDLFKMALDNGWFVDKHIIYDERWTNKQSDIPVMQASFKVDELVRIRSELQNKFFLKNNLPTILAFLKSPYFLFRAMLTIVKHPLFMVHSAANGIRKGKSMDILEDLYQKFNEDLR